MVSLRLSLRDVIPPSPNVIPPFVHFSSPPTQRQMLKFLTKLNSAAPYRQMGDDGSNYPFTHVYLLNFKYIINLFLYIFLFY